MSDNKIVYSNQGIKFLVDDQNNSATEVSKLKGIIDETDYEYLEVSGNVEFLNDVNITGDVKANNIELLPTSTKRVLFNKVGKISSSYDFMWDYEANKLSIVGEISASTFIKGDGSYLINLKRAELDYNTITIGNNVLSLGDSTNSLSGLSSITSTWFTGSLKGNSDTTTKLSSVKTIQSTGDVAWSVSFDGSQNVSATSTLSNTGVAAGTYNNSATSVRPFTVDTKGRITSIGTAVTITPSFSSITSKPTTLSGYGITDAQPLDADLTSIAGLTGTSGYLRKTAANTWSLVSTITADTVKTTSMSTGGLRYLTFVDSSGTGQSLYVDSGILYATTSNTLYVDNIISNGSQLTNVAAETIKTYTFTSGPSDTWTNNAYYYLPLSKTSYQQQNSLGVSSTLKYLPINGTLESTYFKGDGSQLTNLSISNLNFGSTVIGVNNGGTGLYNTPQAGELLIGTSQGGYNLTTPTPGDGININILNEGYITFAVDASVIRNNNTQSISGKKTFSNIENQFTGSFSGDGSQLTNLNLSNTVVGVSSGGTGQSYYSFGDILIGNDNGGLSTATIVGGTGINITNSIPYLTIDIDPATVRNQFSAGTDIQIVNGVISYTGTSGTAASGIQGSLQYSDGSGVLNSSSDLMWDDTNKVLTVGSETSSNTSLRVVSSHTTNATIEAHGGITNSTIQGTGVLYVGQDNRYGGGIFYSGDGAPTYAQNENSQADRISFFRRSLGTNNVVFYYGNSSNSVTFNGSVTATSFLGDGANLTNLNYNNISNAPAVTSPNDSTITIAAGTGLTTGGSFTTNQSFNGTITLNVDSTVVRTNTMQTISGFKTFSSLATFTGGFESTTGYCSGDFSAGVDTLVVDQSLSRVGINTTSPVTFFHVSDGTSVTCIKDTVSKLTVEGGDAHLQIASDDGGNFGSALVLSNGSHHWFLHNVPSTHGTTDTKRNLEFRYKQQTTDGDFISSSTIKAIIKEDGGSSTLNFTGQHRNKSDTINLSSKEEYIGLIVISEGTYASIESNSITINEALPKVSLSSKRNQKSVFGVISDIEDQNSQTREYAIGNFVSVSEKTPEDTRLTINSIGEGGIWICNVNGNLENGDYITTCEIPGYGMKQDSEFLANYTVAKITCDCDFDLNSSIYMCEEFEWENKKYLRAFVGCTYHCG